MKIKVREDTANSGFKKWGLLLGFNSGLKTAAIPAEHWEVSLPGLPELL